MGRVTETYAYLNVKPFMLIGFLKDLKYIGITDNLRKQRRRLKWYRDNVDNNEKINQISLDLFFEID